MMTVRIRRRMKSQFLKSISLCMVLLHLAHFGSCCNNRQALRQALTQKTTTTTNPYDSLSLFRSSTPPPPQPLAVGLTTHATFAGYGSKYSSPSSTSTTTSSTTVPPSTSPSPVPSSTPSTPKRSNNINEIVVGSSSSSFPTPRSFPFPILSSLVSSLQSPPPPPVAIRHLGHPLQDPIPQKNGCPPQDMEKNKRLATTFYQMVFGDKNFAHVESLAKTDMIQHSPRVGDGLKGLHNFLTSGPMRFRLQMKIDFQRVSAEGDLVWIHSRHPLLGRTYASVDIFRIECGKIAEHWDVIQEASPSLLRSAKNKRPFF